MEKERQYYKRTLLGVVAVVVAVVGLIYLAAKNPAEAESAGQKGGAAQVSKPLEGAKILFVIAPKNFRDEELMTPKKYFESLGAATTIASISTDTAVGMLGLRVKPQKLLSEVKAEDYDCVVFVGGAGAPVLWDNPDAQRIAKNAHKLGKPVGAICLAPVILARSGLLKNCNATVFHTAKAELIKDGANYTGDPVVKCGNIITANGPAAAEQFAQTLEDLIRQYLNSATQKK